MRPACPSWGRGRDCEVVWRVHVTTRSRLARDCRFRHVAWRNVAWRTRAESEHGSRRNLQRRAEAGSTGRGSHWYYRTEGGPRDASAGTRGGGPEGPGRGAAVKPQQTRMTMRLRNRAAPPMAEAAARLIEPLRSPPPAAPGSGCRNRGAGDAERAAPVLRRSTRATQRRTGRCHGRAGTRERGAAAHDRRAATRGGEARRPPRKRSRAAIESTST